MERIRRKLEAIEEADIPQVAVTAQSLSSHGLTGKLTSLQTILSLG